MFTNELFLNGVDCNLNGLKIAKVIKNSDPKALERCWVRVLGVHDLDNPDDEYGIWAEHCAYSKGASGEIPNVDDFLYGFFIDEDPNHFVYIGWVRTIG